MIQQVTRKHFYEPHFFVAHCTIHADMLATVTSDEADTIMSAQPSCAFLTLTMEEFRKFMDMYNT